MWAISCSSDARVRLGELLLGGRPGVRTDERHPNAVKSPFGEATLTQGAYGLLGRRVGGVPHDAVGPAFEATLTMLVRPRRWG